MNLYNFNKLVCSYYEKYKYKCYIFFMCILYVKYCVFYFFEYDGWIV